MTTPLPTPPSTSSPSTFESDTDAFLAALPVFQAELDAYQASLSPLGRNMLVNPAFQIDQRNAGASTATADDAYCFDRWYVLTQTGTVAVSQVTDPENGFTHAMRITQSQASAQRFGFAQIIEGKNCKFARGNSGTLVPRVKCSASTTIRYAILGWTGTEDAVTSDVVNSWTNATFTAGNFFNSTTLSVLGTGSTAVTSATWTSLTTLTASLGSSFTNIIIFIWTDSTQAQNVTLDADYVQFEAGASATAFERRLYAQELANCQWYYRRWDFAASTYIAHGNSYSTTAATANMYMQPMRPGTITVTLPAAGTGSNQAGFLTSTQGAPGGYGSHSGGGQATGAISISATGYTSLTSGAASAFFTTAGCSITAANEL